MPPPRGMPRRRSASTPGRIAAAIVKARKSRARRIFSFQSASAPAKTARTIAEATNALRAVSFTRLVWPCLSGRKRPRRGEAAAVILNRDEEVQLEARRHGIVLARPLVGAIVLAGAGGVLTTAARPLSVVGAVLVAF